MKLYRVSLPLKLIKTSYFFKPEREPEAEEEAAIVYSYWNEWANQVVILESFLAYEVNVLLYYFWMEQLL